MKQRSGRTCVLIHGYKRGTADWEHVMWGNLAKRELGRLPKGIEIALYEEAEIVYWGGGADARANHAFALERASTLEQHFGKSVTDLLDCRSFIGEGGSRTSLEAGEALALCQSRGIDHLIVVSDNTHIDRCCMLARKQAQLLGLDGTVHIEAQNSHTSYSEQETILFEPETSYRRNLHDVAARLLQLDSMLAGDVDRARAILHQAIDSLMHEGGH